MTEYDCPHCGQDLRLPPDAYVQLTYFKKEVEDLKEQVSNAEDDVKHYARQLGAANVDLRKRLHNTNQLKEQITKLESTISGYEAVMKSKELLDVE